jgi:hypothetical protein
MSMRVVLTFKFKKALWGPETWSLELLLSGPCLDQLLKMIKLIKLMNQVSSIDKIIQMLDAVKIQLLYKTKLLLVNLSRKSYHLLVSENKPK